MDHKALKKHGFFPKRETLLSSNSITFIHKGEKNMAEKIMKIGIKREPGYLYFLNKQGFAARTKMARAGVRTPGGIEKLSSESVKKEKGYLYFIDKQGDIARAKMARGGHKKKAKAKVKAKTKAKAKVKTKAKGKRRR